MPCLKKRFAWSFVLAAGWLFGLAPTTASAATEADEWAFGAAIYGWFPDISGTTALSQGSGGGDFEIDIEDILANLQFTLMGTFDARRGRWGFVTDVIYMSVENSDSAFRDGTIGGIGIPVDVQADVKFEMESWIWNAAGYYRAVDASNRTLDLLAGVRYIDVSQQLDWSLTGNVGAFPLPDREGSAKSTLANWDFVVGLRGRFAFGQDDAWFIPYHLDVGAGDSNFTWQGLAGLGHAFRWGEVIGFWRYIGYDLSSGSVDDVNFSGPGIGAVFHW